MTRTWIDTHLTAAQLDLLLDWLDERSLNPTSELIKAGMGEALGLDAEELPSLNSVNEWRKKGLPFHRHRRKIRANAQLADALAEAGKGRLHGANLALTQSYIFEKLQQLDDPDAQVNAEEIRDWLYAAGSYMRVGQQAEKLRADLDKLQREKQEWEAKQAALKAALERGKTKGGLTAETLASIEQTLGML
jgi:DNA repair exonuclease SbcCD ATPase subunit